MPVTAMHVSDSSGVWAFSEFICHKEIVHRKCGSSRLILAPLCGDVVVGASSLYIIAWVHQFVKGTCVESCFSLSFLRW